MHSISLIKSIGQLTDLCSILLGYVRLGYVRLG